MSSLQIFNEDKINLELFLYDDVKTSNIILSKKRKYTQRNSNLKTSSNITFVEYTDSLSSILYFIHYFLFF